MLQTLPEIATTWTLMVCVTRTNKLIGTTGWSHSQRFQ